ncbi:MAG: DNA-binding protein [Sphingobacteriales bacterium 50-39]|nr:KilA-N domain-containing protein [Sphingobacteriales bacterium]OJW59570.1 MAG: DNA-binding protein [Sphingobacteriales bacterium 50-39]
MPDKKHIIEVQGTAITIIQVNQSDYISLTNIARHKNPNEPKDIVKNWMRSKTTIEFLGLWEKLHNPGFKGVEFDAFAREAGSNAFVLSPTKWIETTHAIGIISKQGNTGGTYAHKDIAFEFAAWLSAEFKLYLIMEFQRLKDEENSAKNQEWTLQRTLSKINYRIHTDAIKEALIPPIITKEQSAIVYANEADLLNVALFGKTAKQWREQNPDKQGNIRDEATLEQLVVLTNLESINALLIRKGMNQTERLQQLNETAIQQMKSLLNNATIKKLSR